MINKKREDNQFREFIRRNWLILLFVSIVFVLILSFLYVKKSNEIEKNRQIELAKSILLEEERLLALSKIEEEKNLEEEKDRTVFNCNDIFKLWEKNSWIYEINIKDSEEKLKVYCDMETSWGWWTLILTSKTWAWNYDELFLKNDDTPSVSENYSILSKADFIKTIINWKFKYRIDANKLWENWWVWETIENYSFTSDSKENKDIKLIEKYWDWKYYTFGIEERMPYLCKSNYALLTTSIDCNSKWFGTLVAKDESFSPAPWIHSTMPNPELIWYWVR